MMMCNSRPARVHRLPALNLLDPPGRDAPLRDLLGLGGAAAAGVARHSDVEDLALPFIEPV